VECHVTSPDKHDTEREDWNTKHVSHWPYQLMARVVSAGTLTALWLVFQKGCFSLWLREKEREVALPPCYLRCGERLRAKGEKSSRYFPRELNFMLGPTAEWHLWRRPLGGQLSGGAKCEVLNSKKPCMILSSGHSATNFYCKSWSAFFCSLWCS